MIVGSVDVYLSAGGGGVRIDDVYSEAGVTVNVRNGEAEAVAVSLFHLSRCDLGAHGLEACPYRALTTPVRP